jgi:hypothetical protein
MPLPVYAFWQHPARTERTTLPKLTKENHLLCAQLCQLAAKATRKLHKPNTRLQDTTNEVLDRFKETVPMDDGIEPTVEKIHVDAHRERRAA